MRIAYYHSKRSFSKLRFANNILRATMGETNLGALTLCWAECDALKEIGFEYIIKLIPENKNVSHVL